MDSTRITRAAACLLLAAAAGRGSAVTVSHVNAHPEIQMYSYPAGSSNGAGSVRDRAATFGAFSGFDQETQQPVFYSGTGLDPSRRGSFIIAADTSVDVPTGLSPDRYQIESVRVTSTLLGSLVFPPSFTLQYDNTLDSSESLTTAGGDDPGQPIELYGIGLQGDYQSISFDNDPDALLLGGARWRQYREGEDGYNPGLPAGEQAFAPYQYYAVDAAGRDAENAVYGGYSATEPGNTTAQFTPEPFAIGKIYDDQGVEFSPGASVENGDAFVFEPDLGDPRIVAYLQESLSAGAVGFSVSSLHQPAGHTGSVPYPDFYLDDLDVGNNPDGAAPTIEIVVTVLDESSLPGDFNNNGAVDADDYALWRSQFGSAGPEADGNGDGLVDAADYTLWRDAMPPAVASTTATAAPEPAAASLILMFGLAASFCGWVEWFIRPRRSGGDA